MNQLSILINSIIIVFIVINNIFYQTSFQLNQILLNFVTLLLLLASIIIYNKINLKSIFLSGVLLIVFLHGYYFAQDNLYQNRAVSFSLVICCFIFLFFGFKKYNTKYLLYLYIAYMLLLSIIIFSTNNRAIVNPNWAIMTLFYLTALSKHRANIYLFSIIALLSYTVFESRGGTISALTAILVILSLKMNIRYTRYIIIIVIVSTSLLYFYFLDYYLSHTLAVDYFLNNISERGLGGREEGFLIGYENLRGSNFWGTGIGTSGSVEFDNGEKGVHIHFGFLDLALKLSIVPIIIILFALTKIILKTKQYYLPTLAGGLMTIFYYNGLAASHLGLNYLLIILLASSYWNIQKKTNE